MAPSLRLDPNNQPGFWGEVTGTIDWCETNYEVSFFVAEFWNTISNLAFIIPPLVVARRLRKDVEDVYLLSLIYMAFTGLGSIAFHGTLKLSGQLWDELSMAWSGLFILYLILKIKFPDKSFILPLIFYGIFTNFVYLGTSFWTLFEVSYAVIHLSVVSFAWNLHPKADKRLYWSTIIMSTVGFILWNIDNHLCSNLQTLRRQVLSNSFLLTPVTQLHAWWHFFAGYGAFLLVVYCIQARLLTREDSNFQVCFDYLSGICLERIQHKKGQDLSVNGKTMLMNGSTRNENNNLLLKKQVGATTSATKVTHLSYNQTHLQNFQEETRFVARTTGYTQMLKDHHDRKRD